MPLSLRRGTVTAIVERHEGLVRLEVDGTPCVAYPQLTGPVARGDEVLVNVQARGHEVRFGLSGGAADANAFNERGLRCVNLANGMTDIHTPDERIAVADLEAMVDVTLALVEAARAA